MTTPDSTRTAEVDALVLTRRAGAGQHLLADGVWRIHLREVVE
ncbi:hypothetical protein AB1K54_15825 [Microbacterium sp. BWT-B31]